ncbi:MAG: DNA internalization-related competence protein ComEC/Rec2, partial [Congregibacter sp.]|nr:DNA internalization-related competence protein ComEC/Rec2 [Congregibacter sp.]
TFSSRRDRVREAISVRIRRQVPGDEGALLAALAVGDRRAMTPQMWTRLRLYGLTHLMVISGMHITLLALPGWWLGSGLSRCLGLIWPTPAHNAIPGFTALLFAGSYSVLSGFALPAQRALLMLLLLMLPAICGRTGQSGRVLPLAGLGLFALNPISVITASFWLTLGAVALLLWSTAWRSVGGWLRDLWGAQAYMLLAMLPLGLFWFLEASSIGGVLNLLAIPLITFAVVPLLLGSVILGTMSSVVLEQSSVQLLDLAAWLLSLLWGAMAYWEPAIARWSVLHASPDFSALVPAIIAMLLLALPAFKQKIPIIGLLLSPLFWSATATDADTVQLVFFDVGQGTSVLLRQGNHALLYDTGGGAPGDSATASRTLMPMLRASGIRSLDTLIISHPDRDHDAGETLVTKTFVPTEIRRGIAPDIAQRCRLGQAIRFGDAVTLRYLSQALPGDNDNNASCVLLVTAYGRTVLLPGDIDSRRERDLLAYWGPDLQADVLLAAHHGSGSSSSRLWLRSLAPGTMIVTAGRANRFGHPAQPVLDRASDRRIQVLNTASHG